MNQERVLELIGNEEFLKKVISEKSIEAVQGIFKDEGIDLTKEDVNALGDIIDHIAKTSKINDEELKKVNGGSDTQKSSQDGLESVTGKESEKGSSKSVSFNIDWDFSKDGFFGKIEGTKDGKKIGGALRGIFKRYGKHGIGVTLDRSVCNWKNQ